jgi:hypothetical protein
VAKEVKTVRAAALSVGIFMMTGVAGAAPVFLGPAPYLSFSSSPFNGISFSYFHLENFESGALSTPGVTVNPGTIVVAPGPQTDSVDSDDGVIDGSGAAGRSLYSGDSLALFRFTFSAAALGGLLPTHAGIVWTDIGTTTGTTGVGPVSFEAFDPLGVSLGLIGPFTLGDGTTFGGTAEDRFFGVIDSAGISAIEIRVSGSTDWEVDHLQYGAASEIPEPASWILAVTGLGTLPFIRRRRLGPVPFK